MRATDLPCCSTPPTCRVDKGRSVLRTRGACRAQRLRIVLLLLGWTLATGAHWDAIQVFAWGQMLARNARVQPLGAALATTFSPDGMCRVCLTVQAAKRQQDDNGLLAGRPADKAPLLLPLLRAVIVERPIVAGTVARLDEPLPAWSRAAPPVPPPRTGLTAG